MNVKNRTDINNVGMIVTPYHTIDTKLDITKTVLSPNDINNNNEIINY